MRKKTLHSLFDNIFWYTLYLFPVICYLLVLNRVPDIEKVVYVFSDLGFNVATTTIYEALVSIFGSSGVLPLFRSNEFFMIPAYFANVYLIHLAVDFVLFIPRLCHKWMKSFAPAGGGE